MSPFVLVLLFASSALAAPTVSVTQYGINEIAPVQDSGAVVSSFLTDRAFELVDGGDTNIYILTAQQILHDMANSRDPWAQALSISQTIAMLAELAYGSSGDSCEAAAAINDYVSGINTGAIRIWKARLASTIDDILQLATNPDALRYSTGPRGNCAGGGRNYQFEAAWDSVLANSSPKTFGLINEEYCAAKRLYQAFSRRSNNVGAALTAASLPPVVATVERALYPISNFLKAVVNGGNASALAQIAKQAIQA